MPKITGLMPFIFHPVVSNILLTNIDNFLTLATSAQFKETLFEHVREKKFHRTSVSTDEEVLENGFCLQLRPWQLTDSEIPMPSTTAVVVEIVMRV